MNAPSRREALMAAGALLGSAPNGVDGAARRTRRVPVIDVTDLYHPHQDVGDSLDLIAAYALPEVDLRAVIFDATEDYRSPDPAGQRPDYRDPTGPRDPGYIPVTQLNSIFNRAVPCACAPFRRMRSPDDAMRDAPGFQQQGVDLMLSVLRASREPIDIVSFGSARPVALAWNREPELMRTRVRTLHLCAGAAPAGYLEWNVMLDPHAFVAVLRSRMNVAIYPCATAASPFEVGRNNSFWNLENLRFVGRMDSRLQAFLAYAFERSTRSDFLRAVEEAPDPEAIARICARPHSVWETAVWKNVAGRRLAPGPDGAYRLEPGAPPNAGAPDPAEDRLVPCTVNVRPDGQFAATPTVRRTNFRVYERPNPQANQRALRQALPSLYTAFRP